MIDITRQKPIAKGRTAEVYAWPDETVLKLFYQWCPEAWIKREAENARIVSTLPVPSPKLIDIITINRRKGLIFERIYGNSLINLLNTKLWQFKRRVREFAALQAGLHKQEANSLPSLKAGIKGAIESVKILPDALKAETLKILASLPDGRALCHFDFHPDQVMITSRGPMILDWMAAGRGDPLADVARTVLIIKIGQIPYSSFLTRAIIRLTRGMFYRRYIRQYRRLNPAADMEIIRKWLIPVAAARLNENIPGEAGSILRILQRTIEKDKTL